MKKISLSTGLALAVLLTVLLMATFGQGSFTVHMIVHIGIVALAAPLIAHGLSGTRHDPLPQTGWITPLTASLAELAVVWFWHVPALRFAADASLFLSLIEQVSFLIAGLLLWLACFRPAEGRLSGTVGLLFTSMHMTLLGVLLALAPRPLYGKGDVTCFGMPLPAAADQQTGGVVLLMVGAAASLLGGIVLLAGLLREAIPAEEPRC